MRTKLLRSLILFALLGATFFGAVCPAEAKPAGPPPVVSPYCLNPESPVYETLIGFPIPPFWNAYHYNMYCKPGLGYAESPAVGKPAELNLYNGFASATIYGVPGVNFKAFLYTHVPQPLDLPEGWYIYGYGVDIFYDDANVNPDGLVCFALPEGVYGNFELGVYAYDGEDFWWQSNTNCASFTGGGSFFLLMKTDPTRFFWPLDPLGAD